MTNPIDFFRQLLISFGLNGAASTDPIILGVILILILIVVLRLLMGIIQSAARLIVTVVTLGLIAWVLLGMFS